MENIGCYQDKLADEEVFNCFTIIITKSKKFAKPELRVSNTAWKLSKYIIFSGPYFPVLVPIRENSDQKKNSVFGHFSHSVI